MNFILIAGALLGFISMAMAAYASHVLKTAITADIYHFLMTAVRSNQMYAILITSLGLCLLAPIKEYTAKRLAKTAWVFVAGTVLFSFSIYGAILTGFSGLNQIAPLGSILSLLAWLMLIWSACAKERESTHKDYYYFRKPTK